MFNKKRHSIQVRCDQGRSNGCLAGAHFKLEDKSNDDIWMLNPKGELNDVHNHRPVHGTELVRNEASALLACDDTSEPVLLALVDSGVKESMVETALERLPEWKDRLDVRF